MPRPKTRKQIEVKAEELFDRLWYYRHKTWDNDWSDTPRDIREKAALNAQRV